MSTNRRLVLTAMLAAAGLPLIGGCVYRPQYGADSYAPDSRDFGGTTAGTATVTVSYNLVELPTRRQIASGRRVGSAYYDRTGQSFANDRAQRDAANRAAQDAAEQVRMAIAADFAKL